MKGTLFQINIVIKLNDTLEKSSNKWYKTVKKSLQYQNSTWVKEWEPPASSLRFGYVFAKDEDLAVLKSHTIKLKIYEHFFK